MTRILLVLCLVLLPSLAAADEGYVSPRPWRAVSFTEQITQTAGGGTGIGTSSTTQVLFNCAGAVCGSTGLTFDDPTDALTAAGGYLSGVAAGATAPPFSFTIDPDIGMFRVGGNALGFATGGAERLSMDNSGVYAAVALWSNSGVTYSAALYGSSVANSDIIIEGTSSATKTTSDVSLQPTGGHVLFNGDLLYSATAPTIAAGFCTSPSISAANGTVAFTVTIGTACAGSTGSLTMPAATTGWVCSFANVTTPASSNPELTGGVTTTATVTNYSRTTGLATNWTDSEVLRVSCVPY